MLTPRTNAILSLIKGNVLADIGTDHGYLPISAIKNDAVKKAIACDINPAPLKVCEKNVKIANLEHVIETRLGNGLKPINLNEADIITISGMGGMLMWKIITESLEKAKCASNIILQPQHDLEFLRKSLHSIGFSINNEKLIAEGKKFYIIMEICYTTTITEWTDKEYFLGKYILEEPNQTQQNYLIEEINKIGRYIKSIKDQNSRQLAESRYNWLKEELNK